MAHRIDFAEFEGVPDEFRAGWVEIHDYVTVAMRQRIQQAGTSIAVDPAALQQALEAEGGAARLTASDVAKSAHLSIDMAAAEFAEQRETVIRYSLDGEAVRLGGAMFIEELPEELEPVLTAIAAYYERRRRSAADRKSVRAVV